MAFNPRMSIIPPSQTQSRSRKKEVESDAFIRLKDREIVACITDIGITFTLEDLQKPNTVQVQQIFEWFAELLMNVTRETVEPAMCAAAEDICGEFIDTMPPDTRNLLGLFKSLHTLLIECGIRDFSFSDLYKPTHARLAKILSYLINFVRFRESHTHIIDAHFADTEQTKARVEALRDENLDAEDRLAELRRKRKAMEADIRKKTERNEELKAKLFELKRTQEKVTARLEETRDKKRKLEQTLRQRYEEKELLIKEAEKLRSYTLQNPQALQTSITELSNTLAADKAHIDALERRTRALQTSSDSFSVVSADVESCIKLLEEISSELAKEEEEHARKTKQREALSERGNNVREVERTVALLQRQLGKWNERTEKLREHSREKAQEAKDKMEELRALHKKLTEERTTKNTEIERRRVRIEQTEKKMLDLKENIENEVHTAYDEYLKLEAHIKLYITEMEQAI